MSVPGTSASLASRKRALVLGGSIAGMVAARVLCDHFREVVLIERDPPLSSDDSAPSPRRGVPQGKQGHLLLESGRQHLERWFPGICDELARRGAHRGDLGRSLRWFQHGAWRVDCDSDLNMCSLSRPLLENEIRRQLDRLPQLQRRDSHRAVGVDLSSPGRPRVHLSKDPGATRDPEAPTTLDADFVVDALGRGSPASAWLESAGYGEVARDEVTLGLGYATMRVAWNGDAPPWELLLIYGRRPQSRRHGGIFHIENGIWTVGLVGYGDDRPGSDPEDFSAFARSLEHPALANFLEDPRARPLSAIDRYNFPKQQWRRYDRLPRLPDSFVSLGDSVASVDPVFGQGMSLACQQAAALDGALRSEVFRPRAYAQAVAKVVRPAWSITSVEAARYPFTTGVREPMLGLQHRFLDRVFARAATSPEVYKAVLDVLSLLTGPERFLKLAVLRRLLMPIRTPDKQLSLPGADVVKQDS